jgi:hypothetical protein
MDAKTSFNGQKFDSILPQIILTNLFDLYNIILQTDVVITYQIFSKLPHIYKKHFLFISSDYLEISRPLSHSIFSRQGICVSMCNLHPINLRRISECGTR